MGKALARQKGSRSRKAVAKFFGKCSEPCRPSQIILPEWFFEVWLASPFCDLSCTNARNASWAEQIWEQSKAVKKPEFAGNS